MGWRECESKKLKRNQHHSAPFPCPDPLWFICYKCGFLGKILFGGFLQLKSSWDIINIQNLFPRPPTLYCPGEGLRILVLWPHTWSTESYFLGKEHAFLISFLRHSHSYYRLKNTCLNHVTSGEIEALLGEVPGSGSPGGCWKDWLV